MWTTMQRMRIGLALLTLALAVALGAWGDGPRPAAAALPRREIGVRLPQPPERYTTASAAFQRTPLSVSGTNIVRSFTGTTHTISIKNNNSYALPAVRVIIEHYELPIDFQNIQETSNLGFSCVVLDGIALGGARAECSGNQLAAGKELKIKLTGGTTIVTGEWTDRLYVGFYPNYPSEDSQLATNYYIAVNPD